MPNKKGFKEAVKMLQGLGASKAEEVLAEARERLAKEEEWYKRISAGETTVDILGLKKAQE